MWLRASHVRNRTPSRCSRVSNVLPLAREHDLSAYEAAYLELSIRCSAPIATLDRKLRKAGQSVGARLFEEKPSVSRGLTERAWPVWCCVYESGALAGRCTEIRAVAAARRWLDLWGRHEQSRVERATLGYRTHRQAAQAGMLPSSCGKRRVMLSEPHGASARQDLVTNACGDGSSAVGSLERSR
jgi:hypothetical protein